jgi:hypothetical protein
MRNQNYMKSLKVFGRWLRPIWVLATLWSCGCTTVLVYQSPVSEFRTAVNAANDSIRPYLAGVNKLNAEANLYDKINLNQPWGFEDLKTAIPPSEIQLRLQSLSVLASYANALGAMAESKDVDSLGQAADNLRDDVNGLSATFASISQHRQKNKSAGGADKGANLDIGSPLASLVKLFGTIAIERKERKALEQAIIAGEEPVNKLIDLLKADLQALTLVDNVSYAAMEAGMIKVYNDARSKTDPKGLLTLIDQFLGDIDKIQTLRAVQVDSLLSDMKTAHSALVTFAKSNKSPKDLGELAAQIDVFTAHVKLFQNAILSVESINHSK